MEDPLFISLTVTLWSGLALGLVGTRPAFVPSNRPGRVERVLRSVGWVWVCSLPAAATAIWSVTSLYPEYSTPVALASNVPWLWMVVVCGSLGEPLIYALGPGGLLLAPALPVVAVHAVYQGWIGRELPWNNARARLVGLVVLLNSLAGLPALLLWLQED